MERLALIFLLIVMTVDPATADSGRDIVDASGIRGGLIVHLGCGDGRLTAALRINDRYLVHGLDRNSDNIRNARAHISQLGSYGVVTVDRWTRPELPYIDNLVNLLVVGEDVDVPRKEVMRVLAPGGVATVKKDGHWTTTAKPRPAATDEWTHYLHGPNNNAVSGDRVVSYPYHMQWVGLPKWTRNHNYLNSYSAVVSAAGRIVSILDEAPAHSIYYPPKWSLVARDAYNGIVLWKKPIGPWEGHLRRFRSGPTELPRRLVAWGEQVYVTLGYGRPVTALDAASGQVVRVYEGTGGTHEIVFSDGTLYLVSGLIDSTAYEQARRTQSFSPPIEDKRILAIDAETGREIWTKQDSDTYQTLPTTLCVDKTRLFFNSPDHVVCLDRKAGNVVWKTRRPVEHNRLGWSAPTLVVYQDVVLSAEGKHTIDARRARRSGDSSAENPNPAKAGSSSITWKVTSQPGSTKGGQLIAFRASDGKELWRCEAAFGYSSPPNLFVAGGLVWVSAEPGMNQTDITEGRDPLTGEIERRINTVDAFDTAHHHRCYRDKATDRYILFGRTGVEFVDLATGDIQRHFWIRGTCQYGLLPANGLMYLPGHSCGCYIQSKLNGFWALAPKKGSGMVEIDEKDRLEEGPAFGILGGAEQAASDWPMLRHDPARSSATKTAVSGNPQFQWKTKLGCQLTSPVISGDRLVVALSDSHSVAAIDTKYGNLLWQYTTGGKIDSPPALYKDMAVVGSHDGYVYCLRLSDGQLAWRFRAAPADRRSVAFGQIESVWPVIGSVLIYGGSVYCTAGRTSYLDGGITLFRLDPRTGTELGRNQFYSRDPETGKQPDSLLEDVELPGTLPDILTVEKESIFLRDKKLDADCTEYKGAYVPHLYSSAGLLDDNWWHRTYWIWGERAFGRASGWAVAGRYRPSGRILVHDGPVVYGYEFSDGQGVNKTSPGNSQHTLFCADKRVVKVDKQLKNNNAAVTKYMTPDKVVTHWSRSIDLCGRAMVKAGDILFVAGPESAEEIYFDDENAPSVLVALDARDGRTLSQTSIDSQPVFDGMAVASGRIYISLINGEVICLGD
ncbi:MAG: outer membrane protein assembly factor BamB family protein [Planctomycetota bacterium]|jgi:outer membrane protein assembly factor BamB